MSPDPFEKIREFTRNLEKWTEENDLRNRAHQIEREVRARAAATANGRAALAVIFGALRPDGRPTHHAAYLAVAQVIGMMGDCSRPLGAVGAVAVREHVPLAWGYVGTEPGAPGCLAGACPRAESDVPSGSDYHNCISRHAEVNLIGFAVDQGISLSGATVYISREPCAGCRKVLNAARIKHIIWPDELTRLGSM